MVDLLAPDVATLVAQIFPWLSNIDSNPRPLLRVDTAPAPEVDFSTKPTLSAWSSRTPSNFLSPATAHLLTAVYPGLEVDYRTFPNNDFPEVVSSHIVDGHLAPEALFELDGNVTDVSVATDDLPVASLRSCHTSEVPFDTLDFTPRVGMHRGILTLRDDYEAHVSRKRPRLIKIYDPEEVHLATILLQSRIRSTDLKSIPEDCTCWDGDDVDVFSHVWNLSAHGPFSVIVPSGSYFQV